MVEIARYEEAGRIGEVELREYPELTLATVAGQGDDSAVIQLHLRREPHTEEDTDDRPSDNLREDRDDSPSNLPTPSHS
jgi:hypothetical protein